MSENVDIVVNTDRETIDNMPDIEVSEMESSAADAGHVSNGNTNVITSEKTKDENDPYAYLDIGFTSEKFKIEIRNLPKYYGMRELRKLLNNKLKLGSNKVKAPTKGSFWVYVCFRSDEEKAKAIEVLNGYKWKGNVLKAENAKAVPDPLVKRRLEDSEESQRHSRKNKRQKVAEGTVEERLKDATQPLWRLSYEEQLAKKEKEIHELLKRFGTEIGKVNPDLRSWLTVQKGKYNGLPCEVWPIRHAPPSDDGYRNKCEFTVGLNEAGVKTVGFRLGTYATGSLCVAEVDALQTVPARMKQAVKVFEQYVRESPLDVFNPETHQGYWRQLTARYGFQTDQLMLIVGLHPQSLSATDLDAEATRLTSFFTEGAGSTCAAVTGFLQLIQKRSSDGVAPVFRPLWGEGVIREKLLGREFRISPQAFFQVNTAGAEILYSSIADLASLSQQHALLDVCCGTGSIGICLSDKCGEVLGLELSPEAIQDAEQNAVFNHVTNAKFYAGKAEEILGAVTHRASLEEMVAVVDPPRAGLHHHALAQLRKTRQLDKLVYVSCEPKLALKNFVDLTRASSKVYHREPFVPVRAVPVDMFPFTNHCELVIFFERFKESEPEPVAE